MDGDHVRQIPTCREFPTGHGRSIEATMSRKFAGRPRRQRDLHVRGTGILPRFFPPALQRSALCEFSSISTFPMSRLMQPLEMALLVRNLVALLTKLSQRRSISQNNTVSEAP